MNASQRMSKLLRESFSARIDAAFKEKFRRNLTTEFNIVAMQLISRPSNGKPFTPKQRGWVDGFSAGYQDAMDQL